MTVGGGAKLGEPTCPNARAMSKREIMRCLERFIARELSDAYLTQSSLDTPKSIISVGARRSGCPERLSVAFLMGGEDVPCLRL